MFRCKSSLEITQPLQTDEVRCIHLKITPFYAFVVDKTNISLTTSFVVKYFHYDLEKYFCYNDQKIFVKDLPTYPLSAPGITISPLSIRIPGKFESVTNTCSTFSQDTIYIFVAEAPLVRIRPGLFSKVVKWLLAGQGEQRIASLQLVFNTEGSKHGNSCEERRVDGLFCCLSSLSCPAV